jgi:hypothetical protein
MKRYRDTVSASMIGDLRFTSKAAGIATLMDAGA